MSQTMTMVDAAHNSPDPASFTAIVTAALSDTSRSSGSLESTTSQTTTSTSLSAPSLETSHSASSATSTAASSPAPSPCPSILLRSDSPLTFPSRTGSLPGSGASSPSITFAPLPRTEPRKRNPSHQLGVAARSRLLRHRRMLREQGLDPADYPYPPAYPYGPGSGVAGGPGGVEEDGGGGPVEIREAEAGVDAHEDAGARRHRARSDPSEDALLSIGKLVKGAGKSLWKSLSMRDMRPKEREEAGPGVGEGEGAGDAGVRRSGSLKERKTRTQKVAAGHLFRDDHAGQLSSGEGGVWEEEVEQDSWKKLLSGTAPLTIEPEQVEDTASDSPVVSTMSTRKGSLRRTTVEATKR